MPALGSSVGDRPPGSSIALGEVVGGKYRIEREVGRGGMGIVFAATHMTLDRLVAIKVMKADLLADKRALERLVFEAKSVANIESEHVAKVLDVEVLPNGIPYIVMEFLDGADLGAFIESNGALEVEPAVTFILQACEALAEVHGANLVHRDLKPGNLFIAQRADGSPSMKVVDFGISKYVGGPGAKVAKTTSPHVLGSPFYMAPEQMRADSVDARSDIWALGAILFEMLTARTPFVGETLPEVYASVLGDPPTPVSQLVPSIPPAVDAIVQRCLAKDPRERFADVAELARALAPFGGPGAEASVQRIGKVLKRGPSTGPFGGSPRILDSTARAGSLQNRAEAGSPPEAGWSSAPRESEPPAGVGGLSDSALPSAPAQQYTADDAEEDPSVLAALADIEAAAEQDGYRREPTVVLKKTRPGRVALFGLLPAVGLAVAAVVFWPDDESASGPLAPVREAKSLKPQPEGSVGAKPASATVASPAGKPAQKPVPGSTAKAPVEAEPAPGDQQAEDKSPLTPTVVPAPADQKKAAPRRPSPRPQTKALPGRTKRSAPPPPKPSPKAGAKPDYWDSDNFGSRR